MLKSTFKASYYGNITIIHLGEGYGLRKLKGWIGYVADFNWNGNWSFPEIILTLFIVLKI